MLAYISIASLKELNDPRAFQTQALQTWRIFIAVVVIQLAAGAITLYLDDFPSAFADAFRSFWFGGVIVSFPAFLCGFTWQYLSARSTLVACKPIVTLMALCSAALSLLAWPMSNIQTTALRSAV